MTDKNNASVQSAIHNYLKEEFLFRYPGVEVDYDTDLIETGIVDSVGLLRLVAFLESEFGIVVPPNQIVHSNLNSLDCMANLVARHGGAV